MCRYVDIVPGIVCFAFSDLLLCGNATEITYQSILCKYSTKMSSWKVAFMLIYESEVIEKKSSIQ